MRRIALIIAISVLIAMVVPTSPALADDWNGHHDQFGHDWGDWDDSDWNDWDEWDNGFFAFPFFNVIDDVEFENVGQRSSLEGDCVVEDIDLDGWIAEWEVICYV